MQCYGDSSQLKVVDLPHLVPRRGEVLVKIEIAGVNFLDIYQRSGQRPRSLPFIPGVEGVGTVLDPNDNSRGLRAGDRVAWVYVQGSYAQNIVVPESRLIRIPNDLSDELVATSLLQGMSAAYLTSDIHQLRKGDAILVQGANAGTRRCLLQLARAAGAQVIATVFNDPYHIACAEQAGASLVLRRDFDDVPRLARWFTNGCGVHVAYDGLGAPSFDGSRRSLKAGGKLVIVSEAAGKVGPIDPAILTNGSIALMRPVLADFIRTACELESRSQRVFELLRARTIDPMMGWRFALGRARDAHNLLATGAHLRKPLLYAQELS